jgi:predicted MPP superfamily phosphohydrolase
MKRLSHVFIVIVLAALALTPATSARQSVSAAKPATAQPANPDQKAQMPNTAGSLKIAVLGDFGTGSKEQYQLADQMSKTYGAFPYELVVLVGDNLYGSERPQDFKKKFEVPYKAILDKGVKFYASLGNHDDRAEQINYKLFNMGGKLHYTLRAPHQNVRFFFFESTYPEPDQIAWLEKELKDSNEDWKVVVFHHPLYSSGERHGSDTQLRDALEPLFVKYGVSLVFTGHDHFYERIKPQKGILYFVTGSGGQLRAGNIDRTTGLTASGFDTDNVFLIGEFVGDQFTFQAISRMGKMVDSGTWMRRKKGQ